ncbi:Endoplasmic reticulum oxidoreductin-1 [Spathaspora sp. JA1]|nr:Endoplasmic reticulum oxidoreductin-1 [Spathaspora sp. JA1]
MRVNITNSIIVLTSVFISSVFATVHQYPKADFCPFDSPEFCSQIVTSSCNTTFSYIDELNQEIRPHLESLIKTTYFRYFKVDLEQQCKFWDAQHFCASENCAVEIDEDFNWTQVTNESLKPFKLGALNLAKKDDKVENPIETEEVQVCEDLDYCHIDDSHECVYVDLLKNPERFTGYGGNQSFDVWKAIYSENCFPNTNPMSMLNGAQEEEQCVEKNLFYRLISGLHASIAVHLSNEYLNSVTGEFYPNLKIFMERVGYFNDRLANIYFNYALVSQSLVKLNEILPLKEFILSGYDDISPVQQQQLLDNNFTDKAEVYEELLFDDIIPALSSNLLFNTSSLFGPGIDPNLKNEFRARFKNVSAIMDCVGCDRCRMWGKIQTIGYGTALKILFESEDPINKDKLKFRRIEIVALINTLDRLSRSIKSINNFKEMYLEHLRDVALGISMPGEMDKKLNTNAGFAFPFVSPVLPKVAKTSTTSSSPVEPEKKDKVSTGETLEDIAKIDPAQRTFSQEFKLALDEVWQALKFIFGSYKNFPLNLGKIGLVKADTWWNEFIGKPVREYESRVDVDAEQYSALVF